MTTSCGTERTVKSSFVIPSPVAASAIAAMGMKSTFIFPVIAFDDTSSRCFGTPARTRASRQASARLRARCSISRATSRTGWSFRRAGGAVDAARDGWVVEQNGRDAVDGPPVRSKFGVIKVFNGPSLLDRRQVRLARSIEHNVVLFDEATYTAHRIVRLLLSLKTHLQSVGLPHEKRAPLLKRNADGFAPKLRTSLVMNVGRVREKALINDRAEAFVHDAVGHAGWQRQWLRPVLHLATGRFEANEDGALYALHCHVHGLLSLAHVEDIRGWGEPFGAAHLNQVGAADIEPRIAPQVAAATVVCVRLKDNPARLTAIPDEEGYTTR
eukprot:scaffold40574_cov27-Tisochrysis_lutea.AAC.12